MRSRGGTLKTGDVATSLRSKKAGLSEAAGSVVGYGESAGVIGAVGPGKRPTMLFAACRLGIERVAAGIIGQLLPKLAVEEELRNERGRGGGHGGETTGRR